MVILKTVHECIFKFPDITHYMTFTQTCKVVRDVLYVFDLLCHGSMFCEDNFLGNPGQNMLCIGSELGKLSLYNKFQFLSSLELVKQKRFVFAHL